MDFLKDKIKPMYLKYLSAAFGSALISSIYSVVDMAMVGNYQGPEGTAALAAVMPLWNIIYSLGLLMGIGGSVMFSAVRGRSNNDKKANEYFSTALIGVTILAVFVWVTLIFFDQELLKIFGATGSLMPLARKYVFPIKFVVPAFLFNQMLAAFLRNDGSPALATKAVLAGGVFNIFGDYYFVFVLNLGMTGAGIATGLGAVLSLIVMISHFWRKNNTLTFSIPQRIGYKMKEIVVTGFSTFFIDVAMGILTILFNRQILKYFGTNELSIYGVIINISTFAQCCAYSIGQASQPIISTNYGAGYGNRIKETLKYAIYTAGIFGMFWTILSLSVPNFYIKIFMTPTKEVLNIAPSIIRTYSISFILLPFNIFSTYYFQSLMKPKTSFIVSVLRGAIISAILIILLPMIFKPQAIWFAMPITELLVFIYVIFKMKKYTGSLKNNI